MADGSAHPTMYFWNSLSSVDRKFTKPITGKSYKGDSPNPTYIIMKLTEVLGPIGRDWGFKVMFDRTRYGMPHQIKVEETTVMRDELDDQGQPRAKSKTTRWEIIREEHHEVCIRFWFRTPDGNPGEFDAFGGTPMLYMSKNGRWMHDEDAAKKSLTDAYTKGASWLGACADIFLGIFDDKYTSQPHQMGGDGQPGPSQGNPPQNDENPLQQPSHQQSGERSNSNPFD